MFSIFFVRLLRAWARARGNQPKLSKVMSFQKEMHLMPFLMPSLRRAVAAPATNHVFSRTFEAASLDD
jgi:hypothetical protein